MYLSVVEIVYYIFLVVIKTLDENPILTIENWIFITLIVNFNS